MRKIKALSVFGIRPDAIKMCPLVLHLGADDRFESTVAVSGQHREMLDTVLHIFGVTPNYDLNIMRQRQTLDYITTAILNGIGEVYDEVKPDIVLVHGDTLTCFASGLAAFYRQIPVAHVEAGLRSGNINSPFPEEMSRSMIARIAAINFAPTELNRQNLIREACPGEIYVVGNTEVDAMRYTVREGYEFSHPEMAKLACSGEKLAFMTAHRRENIGTPLEAICRAVRRLADDHSDIRVLYAVHLNPAVRDTVYPMLSGHPRITLTEPTDVLDTHNFIARCRFVMSDSGGIQEDATALGVPTLVLRRETERTEGVDTGILKLVGVDEDEIYAAAALLASDDNARDAMAKSVNPYGDGYTSQRIADILASYFERRDI